MTHFVDIGVGGNLDTPLGVAVVLQVPYNVVLLTPDAAIDLSKRLSHWAESMKFAAHQVMTGGEYAELLLSQPLGGQQ